MWLGPKLKFARSRIKLEDAAALLVENWAGDRWGHTVRCSPFDFFQNPRHSAVAYYTLFPAVEWAGAIDTYVDQMEKSPYERFELRPCTDVPEGEVWLSFPSEHSL